MKSARAPLSSQRPSGRSRAGCDRTLRRGFTLFEVLVVLSLLVLVVSLVWPPVSRMLARQELRQGAERVGTRLSAARVHAIETGLTYQFRFEPGGRRFMVVPFDQEYSTSSTQAAPGLGSVGGVDPNAGGGRRATRTVGMLPASIKFEGGELLTEKGSGVPDEWLSGLPDSADYQGALWSGPVLFYPDGTATTVSLMVQNKKHDALQIDVRGLTGGVKVTRVE